MKYFPIGYPTDERTVMIEHGEKELLLGIDYLRDVWFETSYLLDRLQSGAECAAMRFENYKKQPIRYRIPASFKHAVPLSARRVSTLSVRWLIRSIWPDLRSRMCT